MTLPTAPALDQPLPDELAGRNHGWFTRYRRYPVFSRPWVRGRWRLWGTAWVLAMLVLAGSVVMAPTDERAWWLLAVPAVQTLLPMATVPWLALWIRRRGWPAAREWQALVLLFLLVGALLAALHRADATEPVKQWIAERSGLLDASGKRRKVQLSVGVSVHTPGPDAARPRRPAAGEGPAVNPSDWSQTLIWTLIGLWLAGGAALWGWRREQADLAALAREHALRQALAARREAELQLSVLTAQVEPHFLFNTLAGVRSAIDSDPARASQLVDRLCDYLRATIPRLRSDGSAQTTLGGQLDIVQAYLALMATRMPRMRFDVQASAPLRALPFPPWLLVTLAENAVKHGVEPKVGPAQVRVTAEAGADGSLAVTVADDGVGFGGSTSGSGLGLANIRGRLQQMYGDQASLQLTARPGGGVAATVTLPPARTPPGEAA